jgi:hypothetical protein
VIIEQDTNRRGSPILVNIDQYLPACGALRRAALAPAAKEAAARRALGPQMLEDAERLVLTWNARQEAHMPMLFSPTIGAALTVRC